MSSENGSRPSFLMTVDEASAYLNVSERWLRDKVRSRAVPFTRVGKFIRSTPGHIAQIIAVGDQPVVQRKGSARTRL
jgi:excisionase family DNA binding protein